MKRLKAVRSGLIQDRQFGKRFSAKVIAVLSLVVFLAAIAPRINYGISNKANQSQINDVTNLVALTKSTEAGVTSTLASSSNDPSSSSLSTSNGKSIAGSLFPGETTTTSSPVGGNSGATATTTTSLPQNQIDSISLQIYTDNENLIKTSEAFDQQKLKLKFEQLAIDLKYLNIKKEISTVNSAKASLRQAAIQGAILELSGDNSTLQALRGVTSLNSEIKTQFSDLVVNNLFDKMKSYEELLDHENSQLLGLNNLKTVDSLTLLSLNQEQSQAIQQVSKDQALLDSAGSSLGAILTLVQQYQFGNFLSPQESQQITAYEQTIANQKAPPVAATPNELAVYYAEQKLGLPYIWGGAGPFGYDCSGLTMSAWGQAGVTLIHSAAVQYQEVDHIPLWDLQPGDLLFYDFSGSDNPANIDHVVMYIGNNLVIQAAYTGTTIMISPVWANDLVGAGRPVYPNMPSPPAANATPPPNVTTPTFAS